MERRGLDKRPRVRAERPWRGAHELQEVPVRRIDEVDERARLRSDRLIEGRQLVPPDDVLRIADEFRLDKLQARLIE